MPVNKVRKSIVPTWQLSRKLLGILAYMILQGLETLVSPPDVSLALCMIGTSLTDCQPPLYCSTASHRVCVACQFTFNALAGVGLQWLR